MNSELPSVRWYQTDAKRVVSIFPELRSYREDAHELAADGAEFVISRYRDAKTNLRTEMERIIRKAGLKPWPNLFQNMQSTRQAELAERFPAHVVCQRIGNSVVVAREHDLPVTDAHFETAAALHEQVHEPAAIADNRPQPVAQMSGKHTV